MPRTRAPETAHRHSPRGPPNARTSSSDSDQKPSDGRSARPVQSEQSNQKKLGARFAILESQLGLAHDELKSLKHQFASNKALRRTSLDHKSMQIEVETMKKDDCSILTAQETPTDHVVHKETDVFEVPFKKLDVEPELRNPLLDELSSKDDEINLLKANLDEKCKKLETLLVENESLKSEVDSKSLEISSARAEIEGLMVRLATIDEELERSKNDGVRLGELLGSMERAREELESEMRRLRVQSEQWRKAGAAGLGSKRFPERCGSVDKVYVGPFERVGGYGGYVGSPGLGEPEDGEGRRGSGIRMLWKKKGPK